jgi:hypothetical protein
MTAPRSLAEAPKKTLAERGPSIHDVEVATHTRLSSPPPGRANARPMTGSGGDPVRRGFSV